MPVDYGRLTAREKRELKRVQEARRRAGLRKPIRDTTTVSDVRAETAKTEKAKRDFPTAKRANVNAYGEVPTKARPGESLAATLKRTRKAPDSKFPEGPGVIKPLVGLALFSNPNLKEGFNQYVNWAKRAKATIMDPDASLREQVEAAGSVGMVGGLGGGVGRGKPGVPPQELRPRSAGAEEIIGALPEAKRLRRQQEAGYSAERGKRAAKAEVALKKGGREGYQAALAELKGELPKLKFGALEQFDETTLKELLRHVTEHPELKPFQKINTQGALLKVVDGGVPTKSEIRLLERTFGPDVSAQIAESIPFWAKAKNAGLEIINVPRALKSSFDLSAPFRQGLVLGARHPKMLAQNLKPMVQAFKSPRAYEEIMDEIASRPTFQTMQDSKLQLTDLMGLTTREEGFMSNLAEQIPLAGIGVKASGRAYVAFLNKFRADAFDNYLRMAEAQGLDIENPQTLKSIANWVNTATGRGSVKSLEGAMVPLNALFFSPRLIASRLQLLNPAYYASLDPFARKQALLGMRNLLGAVGLTLGMAKMAGAEVGTDPRSSDFAKIKVGDTRVDIAGGLQQYVVAASRLVKGESVSSTTGKLVQLEGGFAKPSRADIGFSFLENKLAPVPAFGIDWSKNENFAGDKFNPIKEGGRLLLPLGAENAYEGFKGSPGAGVASVGLGSIGFGVQTYKWQPKKKVAEIRKDALKKEQADYGKYLGETSVPAQVRQAVTRKAAIESATDALAHKLGVEKLTAKQKAAVVLRELRSYPGFDYATAAAALKQADNATVESWLTAWRDLAYNGILEPRHRAANAAKRARG